MILRSPRRTPLRRHSLIWAIASPRTKLPNSGQKRPSRRASRVQKRFLTAIFFHRGRRAIFERGDTRSAEGLGRNEPDGPFATLASCQYALTPYEVKERPLLWLSDVQEAEVIFVNQHLSAPISVRRTCWRSTDLWRIAVTQLPSSYPHRPQKLRSNMGSSTQSMFTICCRTKTS
jgi:hypothetical protein